MKKKLGIKKITLRNLEEQQLQFLNGGAATESTCRGKASCPYGTCGISCGVTCGKTCAACPTDVEC